MAGKRKMAGRFISKGKKCPKGMKKKKIDGPKGVRFQCVLAGSHKTKNGKTVKLSGDGTIKIPKTRRCPRGFKRVTKNGRKTARCKKKSS